MYDLKCKRLDCDYNKNWNCTVKHLEIKNDTSCETYQKSEKTQKQENEKVEKIEQPAIRKNIEVGCHAECLFYNNTHCSANGITVQTCDNTYCPNCATFMPK